MYGRLYSQPSLTEQYSVTLENRKQYRVALENREQYSVALENRTGGKLACDTRFVWSLTITIHL